MKTLSAGGVKQLNRGYHQGGHGSGGMIEGLALRSKGLLAPIVAHVAAGMVIFTVVAGALEYG